MTRKRNNTNRRRARKLREARVLTEIGVVQVAEMLRRRFAPTPREQLEDALIAFAFHFVKEATPARAPEPVVKTPGDALVIDLFSARERTRK